MCSSKHMCLLVGVVVFFKEITTFFSKAALN